MSANSLADLDRAHLIHPVMSWSGHEKEGAVVLQSAKGAYVTDVTGRTLLDGFAGLWCVTVGYGQESIVRAASKQMRRLPYATAYFGYGSEPAIRLAARLAQLAPDGLTHIFFTLGGSDAVDTAVRFIRFHSHASGKPEKRHIISLDRGYHGSSSNGAGITGLPAFHRDSDLPRPWQHHIADPYPYRNPVGPDPSAIIADSVAALRTKVAEIGTDKVAAFFCEPVQGSGGVVVPPVGWLAAMRRTARELGILMLVDEVITGFGRTGPMFASEAEGVAPDFMTVAKGLTSGYSPMGAVFVSDEIYQTIRDGSADGVPIGHGLTYSAHPVSAAVALATLDLYLHGGILANGQRVGKMLGERLKSFSDHPLVGDVRSRGMLAGIELVVDKRAKTKPDRALRISERLAERGYENRLIFRALPTTSSGWNRHCRARQMKSISLSRGCRRPWTISSKCRRFARR